MPFIPVPPIVLASQSPRRAQLMELIGLKFEVVPADLDESYREDERPPEHVRRLAAEKAAAVAASRPDALVVGSDTVVVIEGEVLGKPRDEVQALEMLMRLQGRENEVHTGIAVAAPATTGERERERERGLPGDLVVSGVESVRVRFRELDQGTAREYVETGEPMDKAGAYGIQGFGATLVESIEGDYFAVMGLPIGLMVRLFGDLGWRYNFKGLEPL